MNRLIILFPFTLVALCSFGQNGRNYIKPFSKDGFVVDSILSLKGNSIIYLLAGTEFDIDKSLVSYIEHSKLGRIQISEESKSNVTDENYAIPEPEFNGEAYICNLTNNTYIKMEKAIGQVKTKDQFKRKLYVKPAKSPVRIEKGKVQVIIKVPNIDDDPNAYIKISRFFTSITRKLSLARQNEFTGKITYGGYNDQELVFDVKKYGKSSFLLSFEVLIPGEYCISISNPNAIDGKLSVSCFGVD